MLKKWFGKKDQDSSAVETAASQSEDSPPAPAVTSEETGPVKTGPVETGPVETVEKASAWSILKKGLRKTRVGLGSLFRRKLGESFVDDLEAELYAADFGPATVGELLDGDSGIRQAWKEKKIETAEQVRDYLKDILKELLRKRQNELVVTETRPSVILVAGVNGTGKTTSIAKLAHLLKAQGSTVLLAAADTFRAAAVEQLTIWSERLGVEIVTGKPNADPASVAYQAAEQAVERGVDYLIVDTAGRLHTQRNLMRELEKIRSVLEKKIPGAPHESLLVLDATTGQNALNQARSFMEAVQVSGIILAKLDGTAKGGIVVTINNQLEIPVKFVGVGEKIEDLERFQPEQFVEALLSEE